MKIRFKRPVGLLVLSGLTMLSLLLGACSLLIPDQTINDPLGIEGAKVDVAVGAGSSALTTLATGTGTASGSFEDISTPISPASFSVTLPFAGTATVVASSGPQPATITLSDFVLKVTVSDAQNTASFTLTPSVSATLTQTSGTTYSISNVSISGALGSSEVASLNTVITGGGTNSVTATLTLTATSSPDLPAGSTISLTFQGTTATIGF